MSFKLNPKSRKVVILGVDGLQFEELQKINLPNFNRLNIARAYTGGENSKTHQKTSSGPGWMAILTGQWADAHGIYNNDVVPVKSSSIFKLVKESYPNEFLTSIVNWQPIHGFLSNDLKYIDYYKSDFDLKTDENLRLDYAIEKDKAIVEDYLKVIQQQKSFFSFIHLDQMDRYGHKHGFGKEYFEGIRCIDGLLGKILDMVEKREQEDNEDWLIMVITDHGRDEKGYDHGGDFIYEKITFIAMNKKGNDKFNSFLNKEKISNLEDLQKTIPITAVLPTVLSFLRVPIKKEYTFSLI